MEVREYYNDKDYNCAESILLRFNEKYQLGIPVEMSKLMGPFGAGCHVGKMCGALLASLSVIGYLSIKERAHEDEKHKELFSGFVKCFQKEFHSVNCSYIKPKYSVEGVRCVKTIEITEELLDRYLKENGLINYR